MPQLSVVVPVYNEQDNILPFLAEIKKHVPDDFELIWVNDGSTDQTLDNIRQIASHDGRIKCISLSRNFGHQAALMAGMHQARGAITVIMDGDLQHPPALIPDMLSKLAEGADIVSARKMSTEDAGAIKRVGSGIFYRLINFLSDTPIEDNVSDFRAFNNKVLDALRSLQERELFLRGLFSWIGFRQAYLPYHAPARKTGQTKYSVIAMIRLALKGAVSFGFKPIRLSLLFGGSVSISALLYAAFALYAHWEGRTVPGWTSTVIAIMFLGGVQLLMIGMIGEYIASLYSEAKRRPLFLVDERINMD